VDFDEAAKIGSNYKLAPEEPVNHALTKPEAKFLPSNQSMNKL
jgi:hypothetical protein